MVGDDRLATDLRTWQAAGLSLAAGGMAATNGTSAVVAVVALAPMIWAFGRLHRHAPSVASTSDLIARVLGVRIGLFTGLLQLAGYLLLIAGFSRGLGLAVTMTMGFEVESAITSWWWLVWAIAVAALAAALTHFCRTRLLASMAAILAVTGMLVFLYIAVYAIARVASGTLPSPIAEVAPESGAGTSTVLIGLGLTLLGVEAVTTLNSRVSSVSRPLGSAMALIALCAAVGLVAVGLASGSVGLAFDESQMMLVASNLAETGHIWLGISSVVLGSAALLAITLAAVRVAARLMRQISQQPHVGAVAAGVAAVASLLNIVLTTGWGGAGAKLSYVAPMLLMAVYVIAAEANSRLPGRSEAAMALRVWMPTLAVVVVLVLLSDYEFDVESLWAVAFAVMVGAVAALAAFRLPEDRIQVGPAPGTTRPHPRRPVGKRMRTPSAPVSRRPNRSC